MSLVRECSYEWFPQEFEDTRDAEDACYELNGRDLLGDRIVVEMAKGTERGRGGLPMRGQRGEYFLPHKEDEAVKIEM